MSVHEKPVGDTVEWYTPREVFDRLALQFDCDPAYPEDRDTHCWVPARYVWTKGEDGLTQPWTGLVWLNPPYGRQLPAFVDRMIAHNNGVMLVPARTETAWFQRAADSAHVVNFLADRIHFIRDDGMQARSSFGSVLMAFGYDREVRAAMLRFDGWVARGSVAVEGRLR